MDAIATLLKAVLGDLVDNAGLNPAPATTIYGRRPLAVNPEECPLLAVEYVGDSAQGGLATTNEISETVVIEARYYLASVDQAQRLVNDEDLATQIPDAADAIFRRFMAVWNAGPFSGAWQLRPVPGGRSIEHQGLVETVRVQAFAGVVYP